MCQFKSILNTEDGYIVRCNHCKYFNIGFGTNVLSMTFDQFFDFSQTIDEYYEIHKYTDCPHRKIIQIPTIVRSIILLYSFNELAKLKEMLGTARDVITKDKLFVFNDN